MSSEVTARPVEPSTADRLRSITAAHSSEFIDGLRQLINRCSLENGPNLPDYVITDYLIGCYVTLCDAVSGTDRSEQ